MFRFAPPRPRRGPSLTPMIDVVFLLLVFFMLVARFGQDFTLPLTTAGVGAPYAGPPRLVDVTPAGVRLNGGAIDLPGLAAALDPLMRDPSDTVILRPLEGADVQRLVTVIDTLRAAGLERLVLVEGQ
ncbi:ExbD/TolR family protein [Sulfitobacter sabulilitoris]|uniref:Biopolymer transporter ExbD n=1 Tax=Sulfitobacter sabulilitoris TaxID=2562655 RepID=A0A5S3PID4_9RHOB|nr:biopolymer transporter ExbD [Sulfitobacter sabulilitoris]TMM54098.1 biopolymer transporter ExbD [Sulfitobacter sabulilitoris]